MYTLFDYLSEAGLGDLPEQFSIAYKAVPLTNPKDGSPLKPMWSQVTGLNLCFKFDNNRTGIYDKVGAGKSLISYGYAAQHVALGNRVVCLMPPILLGQYKQAFEATLPNLPFGIEIYNGTPKQRSAQVVVWRKNYLPPVVLMTYEIFLKEWLLFSALGFNVLIGDEFRLQNEAGKTYAAVEAFMGPVGEKAAVIMNGTPGKSGLENLYSYIHFVTPDVYRSRLHFNSLHINFKKIGVRVRQGSDMRRDIRIVDSYRNIGLLTENLYKQARCFIPSRKDRPEPNIQPVFFDLKPKHAEQYKRLVNERVLIFDDNSVLDASVSSAIRHACKQAIVDPSTIGVEDESTLFELIDELIEQIDLTGTKVLIAAYYRKTVELLAKHLEKFNPAIIYGGTSDNEKEKNKFLTDASCRTAIVNYMSGGVGLNLQDVCYTVIAAEPIPIPGDFEQLVGRVDRTGQTMPVNVFIACARGTVSVKDLNTMLRREDEIASVVTAGALRAELLGT